MPAWKVFLTVAILGALVAFAVFLIFPDYRPAMVQAWFLKAQGYTPAQSPNDALTKFQKAIKERNYDAALVYLDGDYADEFKRGSKGGKKLATAIDDLIHNVKEFAEMKSKSSEIILRYLDPWPEFRFQLDHKEGANVAAAMIAIDVSSGEALNTSDFKHLQGWNFEPKIIMSMVPLEFYSVDLKRGIGIPVELKSDGNKDRGWRIYFPQSPVLHEKVTYLAEYYGNYKRAMENLKYSIKHDAATKESFENDLRKELNAAK
jgi:hypothetical protein